MPATSTFVDAAAVEAWDTWFRWREGGLLKDLSVEMTWRRVATCLAGSQSTRAGAWFLQSLTAAFARWRLLLDERILATAGTGSVGWPNDGLVAVLNAAAFVSAGHPGNARFDLAAFAETAELAVKALDVAAACAGGAQPASSVLRVGIIGLADAFALLDLPYDSQTARDLASQIGRQLARGTSLGAIRAMQARNGNGTGSEPPLPFVQHETRKPGSAYASLTAISSQPRLALFANNVTDSIDPRRCPGIPPSLATTDDALRAMRQALQPWVHEPITDATCRCPTSEQPGAPLTAYRSPDCRD